MSKKLKFADKIYNQLVSAVVQAVGETNTELLERSLAIVPIDTGNLRDSAFAAIFVEGHKITGQVIYDCDYAVYPHEIIENFHAAPTQAKFLEMPFDDMIDTYNENVSKAIKSVL